MRNASGSNGTENLPESTTQSFFKKCLFHRFWEFLGKHGLATFLKAGPPRIFPCYIFENFQGFETLCISNFSNSRIFEYVKSSVTIRIKVVCNFFPINILLKETENMEVFSFIGIGSMCDKYPPLSKYLMTKPMFLID